MKGFFIPFGKSLPSLVHKPFDLGSSIGMDDWCNAILLASYLTATLVAQAQELWHKKKQKGAKRLQNQQAEQVLSKLPVRKHLAVAVAAPRVCGL